MDMIQLLPKQFKVRIRSQADYAELLFDDEAEMRSQIDEMAKPDPKYPDLDNLKFYRERYSASSNEELKDALSKFYKQPSWKEWGGDA